MNIFMIICTFIICVSGQNYKQGTLDKLEDYVVRRGLDEQVIYDVSKAPDLPDNPVWNVAVEVNDPGNKAEVYFIIRRGKQVKSFALPQMYRIEEDVLSMKRRVIYFYPFDNETNSNLFISMSTDRDDDVRVQLKVGARQSKDLKGWQGFIKNNETEMTLKIGNPIVQYVSVEKKEDRPFYSVQLDSTPSDCICSIVSIQKATRFFSDSLEDIRSSGAYQTMLNKATFTVNSTTYYPEGFLVVVVASPSDNLCQIKKEENQCGKINKRLGKDPGKLSKDITIKVTKCISENDYIIGIVPVVCTYFLLFVVSLSISFIRFNYNISSFQDVKEVVREKFSSEVDSAPSPAEEMHLWKVKKGSTSKLKDSAIKHEIDESNKLENPETLSTQTATTAILFTETDGRMELKHSFKVTELSEKLYDSTKQTSIYKKSTLYISNLMLMSLFYCLPVLQIVKESNKQIDETGNHDLCYFNHLCLKPLGKFDDFNHFFSNLGYIVFGVLFNSLVYIKEKRFLKLSEKLRHNFGVPQQFSLFYAMGWALAMEGILSACYHVCPTTNTFQFDTTFMYLMAILMQMKIFQSRHPDNACSANLAFIGLGVALILEAVSIYKHGNGFWIFFYIVYFIVFIAVLTHHFHIGFIRQDRYLFWNVAKFVCTDLKKLFRIITSNSKNGWKFPRVSSRVVLLIITSVFNIAIFLFSIFRHQDTVSNLLLYIFMGNMFAYLIYYVTMKLIRGEKPTWESWLYMGCGFLMAVPAMYFFTNKEKSSDLSPAESRNLNSPCILLNFYDNHDIWHFLGGGGVFFVFMFLLTIDEDLKYTRRDLIYVF